MFILHMDVISAMVSGFFVLAIAVVAVSMMFVQAWDWVKARLKGTPHA